LIVTKPNQDNHMGVKLCVATSVQGSVMESDEIRHAGVYAETGDPSCKGYSPIPSV